MANIKVSEMTEATSFDDGDYTMIVQANQNKKISKENILGNIENNISTLNTNIGDLSNLETADITSIVNSINSLTPKILWTNPNPSSAISSTQEITLLSNDYDILEVFYIQVTNGNLCYSSRFLKGNSTRMRIHTPDGTNIYRELTYNNNTSYTIQLPYSDPTLANINSLAIPIYIIGYKTGLFNNEGE